MANELYTKLLNEARAGGWSRKQVKDACFKAQAGVEARERLLAELGFAATKTAEQMAAEQAERDAREAAESTAAAARAEQQRLETLAAQRQAAERAAAEQAEREQQLAAAKAAIADGAVIWCDAAQMKGRGAQIGLRVDTAAGRFTATAFNGQGVWHAKSGEYDQFAAECFAVLKAVELACECGLSECVIANDRIGGFEATTKRGYIAAKYLWIARKMAEEHGLGVNFNRVRGADNKADAVSRRGV